MVAFIKTWRKKAIQMYGKSRGLTEDQRARVTSAAHGKSSNPRASKKKTGKVRRMVRRRSTKKRKRTTSKRVPLSMLPSIIVPVGHMLAGNMPAGHTGLIKAFQSGDPEYIVNEFKNVLPYETIGYTGDWKSPFNSFDMGIWIRNLGLIFGGAIVHKAANALGVNRFIAKIPLIGKYLSL